MAFMAFKLTGYAATALSTSKGQTHQAVLRPTAGRPTAAAAVQCRCTAEPQPQPPALPFAAAEPRIGDASNRPSSSAGPAAKLQLPAAPELLGASPQGRWNAVSLAFLGDAVWEASLHGHVYDPANLRQYGNTVAAMVTTQAQAAVYQLLVGEGWLSQEEASLMRWATNSASVAPPSHATRQQYKQATAVEALVAHLYLTDAARLQQLMAWLLQPRRLKQWQQQLPAQVQRPASAGRSSSAGRQGSGSGTPSSAAGKANQRGSSVSSSTPAPGAAGVGSRRVRRAGGPKRSTDEREV